MPCNTKIASAQWRPEAEDITGIFLISPIEVTYDAVMLSYSKSVRRLLNALGFVVAVPTVVTCGGHIVIHGDETGGAWGVGGGQASDATGGGSAAPGAGGMQSTGGSHHISAGGQVGAGGGQPATGGASVTSTWEPKVYLGKYLEPVTDPNYRVPAPPATAGVTRPCNERTEVCAGAQSRETWVRNVVTRCMTETSSGGCIDFVFENGDACAKSVVVWHGATFDMGRCASTVAYYESCAAQPQSAGSVDVFRFGADCSPL